MQIQEATVILHLFIRVMPENWPAFREYVAEAFPIFEAATHSRGAVYQAADDPTWIDEVFYYRTEADFELANRLTEEDPVQLALLARWRVLLAEPPRIEVFRTFS